MKNYWIAVVVAGALVVSAVAQTGASGSAGTQASVSAGQSGADVNASQNTKANAGSKALLQIGYGYHAQVTGQGASLPSGSGADPRFPQA